MDMRQLDMFDTTDYEKLEHMDATVDKIRMRYGRDSLKRAVFVGSRIDHMSGGISREKRTVDYKVSFDGICNRYGRGNTSGASNSGSAT